MIAYPSGLLGRRFGDKQGAILGMTLMIIGRVLTATSHDYEVFLLGRLIGGIGAVLLNVLLIKMATDWWVARSARPWRCWSAVDVVDGARSRQRAPIG